MAADPKKSCFVICPIGDPTSEARLWSNDIFKNVIEPIAAEFGYIAKRSIDDSKPGEITPNIIHDVIDSDLVVADLTGHNANVFYELALRHSRGKPFIQIAAAGTKIPFDIGTINTVYIDKTTIGAVDASRTELRKHFSAVVEGTASFENPVSRYQHKLKAEQTGDPIEKRMAALEEAIAAAARKMDELEATQPGSWWKEHLIPDAGLPVQNQLAWHALSPAMRSRIVHAAISARMKRNQDGESFQGPKDGHPPEEK